MPHTTVHEKNIYKISFQCQTLTECFEFKYHSVEFMSLKSAFLDHVKIQIQNHYMQHFLCTTSVCVLKLNYKICNIMLSSLRTVKGVCFLTL